MNKTNSPRPYATGLSLYRGLPRSIYILFIVRVFNRFGDFVQILLVLILTGKLGLNSSQAGLFVSASILATMFGQLFSAYGSKRWHIKSLLVFCQLVVSASYLLCAVSYLTQPQFIPYLILLASPFRGGTAPLTNTLVAQFSKPDELGRSFSLLYLGTNVGVAIGPVVASLLYVRSLFLLFLFSSCLLLGTTLLLMCGIPQIQVQQSFEKTRVKLHIGKPLWFFFGLFVFYSLLYGQNTFTLPLQFSALYGQNEGSSMFASLMMVNAITVLVATTFLTSWTYRLGQLSCMALAMLFYTIGYGMYGFCTSFLSFLGATVIWTLGEILMATNANVFVNAYSPVALRSQANAYLTTSSSLGHALAPTLGGFFLLVGDYRQLWLLGGALCFLLGCGYIGLNKCLQK